MENLLIGNRSDSVGTSLLPPVFSDPLHGLSLSSPEKSFWDHRRTIQQHEVLERRNGYIWVRRSVDTQLAHWRKTQIEYLQQSGVGDLIVNLSRVHPHLVPLLGFYDGKYGSALGYEFMPQCINAAQYFNMYPFGEHTIHSQVYFIQSVSSAATLYHEHGLVHRDYKPSNILIVWDGRKFIPMVYDYEATYRTGEKPKILAGTEGWAPIEMFRHPSVTVQPTMDIYSIGMMIGCLYVWDALSFGNDDAPLQPMLLVYHMLEALLKSEYAYLHPIIAKATQFEPHNRYQDVPSFRADIVGALLSQGARKRVLFPSKELHQLPKQLLRVQIPNAANRNGRIQIARR